jgi:hypothetical protein
VVKRLCYKTFRHSRGFCVMEDNTRQSALFPDLFSQPPRARFDERHGSSDGGAILLKDCDAALELSWRLAECLADRRQVGKVEHTVRDLLRQRLFGIAARGRSVGSSSNAGAPAKCRFQKSTSKSPGRWPQPAASVRARAVMRFGRSKIYTVPSHRYTIAGGSIRAPDLSMA